MSDLLLSLGNFSCTSSVYSQFDWSCNVRDITFTKLSLTRHWTSYITNFFDTLFCIFIFSQQHFYIFTWLIIDQHRSPDRGRLRWGNVRLNTQTPPRQWRSMLDVTGGGKSTSSARLSPTKLACPKTPPAPVADKWIGSSHRKSSPSPLRYGIGIFAPVLCNASWCLLICCWWAEIHHNWFPVHDLVHFLLCRTSCLHYSWHWWSLTWSYVYLNNGLQQQLSFWDATNVI